MRLFGGKRTHISVAECGGRSLAISATSCPSIGPNPMPENYKSIRCIWNRQVGLNNTNVITDVIKDQFPLQFL